MITFKKIASCQGDDNTTGFLLDYLYFKEHYKLTAIDLSKQQKLDDHPKAIQQINVNGIIENNATMFFIIEEAKETVLDFSKATIKVLWFYFILI